MQRLWIKMQPALRQLAREHPCTHGSGGRWYDAKVPPSPEEMIVEFGRWFSEGIPLGQVEAKQRSYAEWFLRLCFGFIKGPGFPI